LRLDVVEARAILDAQIAEGRRLLATEGVEVETVTVQHEADMQFAGQTHVLTIPIARTDFARDVWRRRSSVPTGSASGWSCTRCAPWS
jgi:hypothetical protein